MSVISSKVPWVKKKFVFSNADSDISHKILSLNHALLQSVEACVIHETSKYVCKCYLYYPVQYTYGIV